MSRREEVFLGRTGSGTRMAFAGRLVLNLVLALVATMGVIWLAGRPGIRQRFDLTEKGSNTLSEATIDILGKLQDPLVIDVFWRGEDRPLDLVAPAAMERVWNLLQLMVAEAGEKLVVRTHDQDSREAIETRLRELELYGYENCLVVSKGKRREVLTLLGALADFDPGDPHRESYRPAAIRSFMAEEAIVQGILKVTRGEDQKVYFTIGEGERRIGDESVRGLSRLAAALTEEALVCVEWDWQREQKVPADCSMLAILSPDAAFPPGQLAAILEWLDSGGRAVITAHEDSARLESSDVPEILEQDGLNVRSGIVMNPATDDLGRPTLEPEYLVVLAIGAQGMASHEITNPLRQADRSIVLSRAHPILVVSQPLAPRVGANFPLLQSAPSSWLDSVPLDYLPQRDREPSGAIPVAAVVRYQPPAPARSAPARPSGELERRPETRMVVFGSATVFENDRADRNGDLARNVFRWIGSREWRLSISPRDPDQRRLPLHESGAMGPITRVALLWIPGSCLVLGALTAFLRSRGGPPRGRP
jgi:hypothetical protein